jgi:hypothetical protein
LPIEKLNAAPEVEGVELMPGRLNADACFGAVDTGIRAGTGTDARVVFGGKTPCLPLTISTSEIPLRFAVIDFHRLV